jgi:methionyl-tRNA formyltransferase
MTPKPDDSDIVGQAELPIGWDETGLSLTLSAAAGRDLVRAVAPELAAGRGPRISQRILGPSSYFGGRKPEDGELDLTGPAQAAFNLVRAAADPWPNAFVRTPPGTVKVAWALPASASCPPGHFRETAKGVQLGFADGALRLHALRQDGVHSKRPTDHARWLRELGMARAEG